MKLEVGIAEIKVSLLLFHIIGVPIAVPSALELVAWANGVFDFVEHLALSFMSR